MIMARQSVLTLVVFIHLLFCWKPGRALLAWQRCYAQLKPNMTEFYDCECGVPTYSFSSMTTVLSLRCIDTGYTDPTILNTIPFDGPVHNITMTGNSFRELPVNLFGPCGYKDWEDLPTHLGLEYLDLSNNNIHVIHGKTFHCTQNLKTLKLNDNNLDHEENGPRTIGDLDALEVLHLTNAFNFDKQGTTDEIMVTLAAIFETNNMESLKELHLENNYIGSFTQTLFQRLPHLEKLYLSHNLITYPVLPIIRGGHGRFPGGCCLQEVYLNSNSITRLFPEFMQNIDQLASMEKLDLSDNPFWCDCSFNDTYNWLRRNKNILVNSYRLTCYGPPKVAGKIVLSLNATDMEECMPRPEGELSDSEEEKGQNRAILIAILVAASCILLCVITVVCYRKKKRKIMSMCDVYCQCLPARRASECIISNPEGSVHM